jgi:hypothetical protein
MKPRAPSTPRPELTPQPVYVSQFTAPALFGFKTERAFLEFIATQSVPRAKVGKQVLVEVEELRTALRRLSVTGGDGAVEQALEEPDALGSADDVLARLGLRRSA